MSLKRGSCSPRVIAARAPLPSPARKHPQRRPSFRIAAVQERWHPDPEEHAGALADGIRRAASEGAQLICLQELTLTRYFAVDPRGPRPGVSRIGDRFLAVPNGKGVGITQVALALDCGPCRTVFQTVRTV